MGKFLHSELPTGMNNKRALLWGKGLFLEPYGVLQYFSFNTSVQNLTTNVFTFRKESQVDPFKEAKTCYLMIILIMCEYAMS